jgi:starch-binding outer membrane protein, SusD/RagB family
MKKYIYLFLLLLMALPFSSCEDYLDRKDPNSGLLTEEDVWRDKQKIEQVFYRLYDCFGWWFEGAYDNYGRDWGGASLSGKNYMNTCQLSGEVICYREVGTVQQGIPGNWQAAISNRGQNPEFFLSWEDSWEAVNLSNLILSKIDDVPNEVMPALNRNRIKGEAFAFRAMAYHEISRRWGPMPYFKERMTLKTDLNQARPSFLQNTNDMVADCDSATYYLPDVNYVDDPINIGRLGKAAPMALKSRVLTTAASPNNATGEDARLLWERAAQAAWEVINLSKSSNQIGLYAGKYNEIFHTLPMTIESLWPRYYAPQSGAITILWVNGAGLGNGPTQEMVDKFEMANGLPIDDLASGYNPQNPYANREPRFYADIVYHRSFWPDRVSTQTNVDMRTTPQGSDRDPANGPYGGKTPTGYLVKKVVPEKFNNQRYVNKPYIRMAEMYLNYAEAVNEAYQSPTAKYPGAALSAVDALNVLRNRVGQVPVHSKFTSSYAAFKERVHNEFWVELCFEFHLWHDLIRWKEAKGFLNDHQFRGMLIATATAVPSGLRFDTYQLPFMYRVFEDKHYRYPLRRGDLQLNPKLEQNPGW